MKTPQTEAQVSKKFGKNFLDATCSAFCHSCRTSNFFVGQFWDETVPQEFNCVVCKSQIKKTIQ